MERLGTGFIIDIAVSCVARMFRLRGVVKLLESLGHGPDQFAGRRGTGTPRRIRGIGDLTGWVDGHAGLIPGHDDWASRLGRRAAVCSRLVRGPSPIRPNGTGCIQELLGPLPFLGHGRNPPTHLATEELLPTSAHQCPRDATSQEQAHPGQGSHEQLGIRPSTIAVPGQPTGGIRPHGT